MGVNPIVDNVNVNRLHSMAMFLLALLVGLYISGASQGWCCRGCDYYYYYY